MKVASFNVMMCFKSICVYGMYRKSTSAICIGQAEAYNSYNSGQEIVTYFLTIRTTEMFYEDHRNETGPMKEEMSGQNWLSTTHQVHVLRWSPTVGSFRCYFENLHKGPCSDYMYSWCAYRVLSSKDIWTMLWELLLKKDSASVNCFIFENGKKKNMAWFS